MPFKLEKPELLELAKATKLLDEADALIRKAAACGFDMQAQDGACQALRERIERIRQTFNPRPRE